MSGGMDVLNEAKKYLLDNTYKKLDELKINQDEIFRQALRCVEHDLFRAAYILSWIALIDVIEEKLASDGFTKLNNIRANWNIQSMEQLRENQSEFAIIEASKDTGFINKSEKNILIGYLNERHQCAHPSNFFPNFYQTIGYISNIIYRMELLVKKPY